MSRSITVSYSPGDAPVQLQLTYNILMEGNVQTLQCTVSGTQLPNWLQLRKFDISSLKERNVFTPLYNEVNSDKNVDTVLFIDKVYADIMIAEKQKVKAFAAETA